MSITETLNKISEEMCNKYCKFPEQYYSQTDDVDAACEKMLKEKCENCPLNKI